MVLAASWLMTRGDTGVGVVGWAQPAVAVWGWGGARRGPGGGVVAPSGPAGRQAELSPGLASGSGCVGTSSLGGGGGEVASWRGERGGGKPGRELVAVCRREWITWRECFAFQI